MGTLKLNVDASVLAERDVIGVGGVIRAHDGVVLGAFTRRITGRFDAFTAELVAIRTGLLFAEDCGLKIFVTESDSFNAVKAVKDCSPRCLEGAIVDDINFLLGRASGQGCQFVSRNGNKVAHTLAQAAFSSLLDLSYVEDYPPFIHELILADMASIVDSVSFPS